MSEIQFKFNFRSKGKNVPEAIKIAQQLNGIKEDNFYMINFSKLQDKKLMKLMELVGYLNNSQIMVDKSRWIHTSKFKIKQNEIIRISLERYDLSTYPEFINKFTSLKNLNLKNNELKTIPESIGNLITLQELDLSENQINTLPESIGNLKSLQELNLNDNRLNTLPESMGNLKSLKKLYINPYLGKMTASTNRLLGLPVKEEIDVFLTKVPLSLKSISEVIEPKLVISPKVE